MAKNAKPKKFKDLFNSDIKDKLGSVDNEQEFIVQATEFATAMPGQAEHFRNSLNESIRKYEIASKIENEEERQNEIKPLLDDIARKVFFSDDKRRNFLYDLFKNPETAHESTGAYAYLVRDDIFRGVNTHDHRPHISAMAARIRGLVLASQFSQTPSHHGIPPYTQTIYNSYDLPSTIKQAQDSRDEAINAAKQCREDVQAKLDSLNDDLEKIKEEHSVKYRDTTELYTDLFALARPTAYWRRRRMEYSKAVKIHLCIFTVSVTLSLILFVGLAILVLVPQFDFWYLGNHIAGISINWLDGASPLTKFLAFGTIVTVIFWVLRIMARHLISAQHMREDASEREVLFTTYLALMQHNSKAIDTAERQIVLSALFRPTQDGFVKDDPGPSASVETLLARLLNK